MTTVHDLFQHAGVQYEGAVAWGAEVPLDGPGVYVISTNGDPSDGAGLLEAPLNLVAVALLLAARLGAAVDGEVADVQQVADRLAAMWPG